MQPPFRSKQEVIVNALLEAVWPFSMELTKILEFHPRVVKVDLLSGKPLRGKRLVFPPSTCVRRIATMDTWKRARFVYGVLSQRSDGLWS